MRTVAALMTAALQCGATPATAEQKFQIPEELNRAFQDMLKEMQPLMEDALEFMEGLDGGIDDPRYYQMPEVLPNGDIIIRRREDAPKFVPPEPEPSDQPEDGSIKT
jgi:hypothetical protein